MFLAGIADEAGKSIEKQIQAHQELGWSHIEVRNVDGKNLTDVDENTFNEIAEKLEKAGMNVCSFGSQIANWARKISGDFNLDVEELKRAIPRMQRLHTKYIRIMSYPNDNWEDSRWRTEVMRRLEELTKMAEVIKDLLVSGYDGGFSIEPHMAAVVHLGKTADDPEAAYRLYVEYGRKAQSLVEKSKI